jgi:dTDP-4-amino-4,6-dideoxygalactose transaminase
MEPSSSARPIRLPLRGAWADERELQQVNGVLASGVLGMGPRTHQFEHEFAAFVGVRRAVAVNSCWAGFHLAFEAMGLKAGDEVITSVGLPAATAAVLYHLKARPILVDVDPETLTLDVIEAERKIRPRTRAIVPIHFAGCPAKMDGILALAARHRLVVVEDALHALPARYRNQMVGAIGDITVFGLSSDRAITTGEGGIVTTESAELATALRRRRSYGVADETDSDSPEHPGYQQVRMHGYGYAMADLNAAVGLAQLRKVQMFHGIRSYYATLYQSGLSDLGELILPEPPRNVQHAWGLYVVRVKTDRLTVSRDAVIGLLDQENVQAGVDFVPLHAHAFYRDAFGLRPREYPRAVAAHQQVLSLPLYPRMSEADVWDVVRAVRNIIVRHTRRRPS